MGSGLASCMSQLRRRKQYRESYEHHCKLPTTNESGWKNLCAMYPLASQRRAIFAWHLQSCAAGDAFAPAASTLSRMTHLANSADVGTVVSVCPGYDHVSLITASSSVS